MRKTVALVGCAAVLAIGIVAAAALGSSSAVTTTTSQTATAPTKTWLCHHTGSWKHPYHLIHVSTPAVPAHRRHGDVDPGAGNSCPSTQPAGAKSHGSDHSGTHKPDKDDAPDKDDDADD